MMLRKLVPRRISTSTPNPSTSTSTSTSTGTGTPPSSPPSKFKSSGWISSFPTSKRNKGDDVKNAADARLSVQEPRSPSLTAFPTELIILILTYPDDRTLLVLAQVSRLFNELAIQEVLSRPHHGALSYANLTGGRRGAEGDRSLSSNDEDGGRSGSEDILHIQSHTIRYLRMALFIRSLPRLACTFPGLEWMPVRIGDLNRLGDFVQKLGSGNRNGGGKYTGAMQEIDLDFSDNLLPSPTQPLPSTSRARQSRKSLLVTLFNFLHTGSLAGHVDTPAVLVITPLGLFTTKVDCIRNWKIWKGCYDVDRLDNTYVTGHDGGMKIAPMVDSIITLRIQNIPKSSWSRRPSDSYIGDNADPPPAHSWTLITIDSFLITHLDLSLDSLSSSEWSLVLQSLNLPNLLEVGIWSRAISTLDSTLFLNRHPNVTILHHDHRVPINLDAIRGQGQAQAKGNGNGNGIGHPKLKLPGLEQLIASPSYISFALNGPGPGRDSDLVQPPAQATNANATSTPNTIMRTAPDTPNPFRDLHTIKIQGLTKETEHTLSEALQAIARLALHGRITDLEFTTVNQGTIDRLLNLKVPRLPSPTSLHSPLPLPSAQSNVQPSSPSNAPSASLGPLTVPWITTLTLIDWPIWPNIPYLISRFPSLEKLIIKLKVPEDVYLRDQMKWRRELVESVWKVNQGVERFVINEMEGSRAWWLSNL
ncbi:hypothetical protein AX16_006084 [Volvariella volvacea WC 439]|nr:hypothetical protein AX16_006084 [Volvariella volvacea WC 439]